MPSGLNTTSIYNMVLDRLAEESILGPSDDRAVARWLNRNYPLQRDMLLAQHPWNFAIKRAALAKDSTDPAFEWKYQCTLPVDCIRVLPLTEGGYRDSPNVPHVIEGLKILTNVTPPVPMRYIARIENEAFFSPHFANALAHILAALISHWLTGKASLTKELSDRINSIVSNAQAIDSLEGSPETVDDNDIIVVR